jgi:O-antigen ligase
MIWLLAGYMWLFIHRPFEVWPVLGTLRIERVYMLMVLAAWLCSNPKGLLANRLNRAFACLFAVIVAAWLFSPYPLGTAVIEDYLKVGVFYVLLLTCVRDERDLRMIITAFLVGMALYALHFRWEYYCGRYIWRRGPRRMVGVDSTYSHPNTFAATLVYALPMLLPFWTKDASRRTKMLMIGYLLLSVTCVLLTGSRTGLVGLGVLAVITTLFLSRRRLRVIVYLCVFAAAAWSVLPEDRQNRYLTIIDPSRGPANAEASADSRIAFFWIGVRLWRENPVLGLGPGAFQEASGTGMQPHNLYAQILSELGTLGAIALLGLLAAFYGNARDMRRLRQECPELSETFAFRVSRAVSVTVVLLLIVGLAGHNLFRYTWMWFGAFQIIALHVATQRVVLSDQCVAEASDLFESGERLDVAWNA